MFLPAHRAASRSSFSARSFAHGMGLGGGGDWWLKHNRQKLILINKLKLLLQTDTLTVLIMKDT